jgi:hypothetical protein
MEAKSGAGVDVGRRLGASRRAGGRGQGRSEAESVASLEAFRRSLPQWKEKSQRQASSDVVLRPLVQCLCANQIASQALAPDFQEQGHPVWLSVCAVFVPGGAPHWACPLYLFL